MGCTRRSFLGIILLTLLFIPLLSTSEGTSENASRNSLTEIGPVIPTGYEFANEVGGEIISVRTGSGGYVYPLTATGCLACLNDDGSTLWKRYYHDVERMDHYVFPNGNLVVICDELELIHPNGTLMKEVAPVDRDYRGNMKAFDDKVIVWQDSRKIFCMDQDGNIIWTYIVNPITMRGIGNASGDYNYGSYELRKDLQMTLEGETLFILYDDPHSSSWNRPNPSIFVRLDKYGKRVSWFEFEGFPWRNFELLEDGSFIITEMNTTTEERFAVRINKDGKYQWKVHIEDYSSKMILKGENGRMLYYRLMADWDEENLIFVYSLNGTRVSEKLVLPRTTTGVLTIGENIILTDMINGTMGRILCFDRDMSPLWERIVPGGILSNVLDSGDGTFFMLSNSSMLQRWNTDGDLLWETRTCVLDNIYMNDHMESIMDYEIGYTFVGENFAQDALGNIYLGLMRLFKFSSDGRLKWEQTLDGIIESSPIEGLNGDIIMGGMDGFLYSFDKRGNTLWKTEIGAPIGFIPTVNLSRDGYIVLDSMGSMRFVGSNGGIKWTIKLNGSIYSQHLQDTHGNIYAATWRGTFYSIHPNGTVNWTLFLGSNVGSGLNFIGKDRIAFFSDYDLLMIDVDNRTYMTRDCGAKHHNFFYSGPVPVGNGEMVGINETVVWFDLEGNILRHCPDIEYLGYGAVIDVGPDGRIYIGCGNSGRLYCVMPNGSLDWTLEFGDRNVRPRMFDDGTLLVACEGLSKIDPFTGDIDWNFKMDFRTHVQGYTLTIPYVMDDGSILFAFDRVYRFTDTASLGQFKELRIVPFYGHYDVYWYVDIPPEGAFLKGFRVFRNGTDGKLVEYTTTTFANTRIDEYRKVNYSLVYDYQVEWFDHLGNKGRSRVFNNNEDYYEDNDNIPINSEIRNLTARYIDGKVHLDWEPPNNVEEYPVYSYVIYRFENKEWVVVDEVDFSVTHYEDGNISQYYGYWYGIVAWTEDGPSDESDHVYVYTSEPFDLGQFIIPVIITGLFALLLVVAGLIYTKRRNDGAVRYDDNGNPTIVKEGVR